MIDILTLALTHGLMALAALILVTRNDLEEEGGADRPAPPWQRPPAGERAQD